MNDVRLICFDLDDTLWPCMPTILKAEQTLYRWLELNKPKITDCYSVGDLREKRLNLVQSHPHLKHNLSALRKVSFLELAKEFNDDSYWVEDAFTVFYEARQKIEFYEDVETVLTLLKQRFQIAAMTNGNADIYRTPLGSLFNYSISAEKVGAAKPDKQMFRALLELSGLAENEILYVGDHPVHDIEGSNAMGITNVWMNREGLTWTKEGLQPDYIVQNLHEMLNLLSLEHLNS